MKHRGYTARPVYSEEDRVFHGRVDDIADVVTFEGETVAELEAAFRDAVDTYIAFAEEQGRAPERPCSGKFVLRIPPEVHRAARAAADAQGVSLNAWVQEAVELRLSPPAPGGAPSRRTRASRTTPAGPRRRARARD